MGSRWSGVSATSLDSGFGMHFSEGSGDAAMVCEVVKPGKAKESSHAEKILDSQSLSGKVCKRTDSGTCNVCAAPCSSCMHFNRAVSFMGSKTDEFSDETYQGKVASRCSVNDADVLSSFKSRACDDRQRTGSETSNLFSVSSSRDSLSENAESKATERIFDTSDTFEDVEMFPKTPSGETVVKEQLLPKPQSVFSHRILTNQYEEHKGLDCDGDNVSCVSGANDANMVIGDHNCDADRKNVSCNSASVRNLLPEGLGKAIHVQNSLGCLADIHCEVKESHNNSKRPSTCTKESIRKKHPIISSATAVFPDKLEPSDSPSSRDVYTGTNLLKKRNPYSHSQSGKSLFCNPDAKDLEENSCYRPQEELSECSMEKAESSLAKVAESDGVGGQKSAMHNYSVHPKLENSKASLIRSSSSACLECETNMDSGEPPAEAVKCSDQSKQVEKSRLTIEVPDVQEPSLRAQPANDNDGSEIVVDVKVCDICGDAGREDLLAICSSCSDGAEHTYCMQLMLDKVPEGDWLCEECKLKEETEKEKQDKFETVLGTSKGSSLNEISQNSGSTGTVNSKLLVKLDIKESDVEGSRTNKVSSSSHISAKRHADNLEVASAAKRQALETKVGSPKVSSSSKETILSRDCSFKNLDKGKVMPTHKVPSFRGSFTNKTLETAHSPTTSGHDSSRILPQLQMRRGTLLKSLSFSTFNSKPKVKRVVDDVSQKKKLTREPATGDTKKEGPVRMISKSMSFKTASSSCSNAAESKVKMVSSNFSRVDSLKGVKQARERNSIEKKCLVKSDRPLVSSPTTASGVSTPKSGHKITSPGETKSSLSSATNHRDFKAVQPDGKLNSPSKRTSNLANKGSDILMDLAGSVEVKRQSSHLYNDVGAPSSNGVCSSSDEKKPNEISPKDELTSSSSWTTDGLCRNPDAILQDSLLQSPESTNQDGKAKETSFCLPRQSVSAGSRSICCHNCKEIGHTAQFCPIGSPRVSILEVSAARSSREVMNESSKLKKRDEVAMLKIPGMYKKKRFPDQSDELSTSSTNLNCEVASNDQLSTPSSWPRNLIPTEGTYEAQEIFRSSTSDSSRTATVDYVKQDAIHPNKAVFSPRAGSDAIFPSDEKPSMRDLPRLAASMAAPYIISAIPEKDHIWKGGFQVQRSGLTDFCDGIQAHLSTHASPKVLEVVNKFPCTVILEEVARLITWPTKFQDNCATEDDIALYFFAKDLESYERYYKNLLENVIKNDLALKGNIDGIELLIFPSNKLPEKSQRWNMLFYLWGVFRGRRVNCSEHISGSPRKLSAPNLNVIPSDQDLPVPVMSVSQNICSPGNMDKELSACNNRSCKALEASNFTASVELPFLSYSGRMDNNLDIKVSSLECSGLQTKFDQQASGLESYSLSPIPTSDAQFCREIKCATTSLKESRDPEIKPELELQPYVQTSSPNKGKRVPMHFSSVLDKQDSLFCSFKMLPVVTSLPQGEGVGSVDEKKIQEKLDSSRDQVKVQRKLKEEEGLKNAETAPERETLRGMTVKEHSNWELNSRKRPHSGYPETVSQASGETSTGASRAMQWNEKMDGVLVDGERDCKKMRFSSGMYGYNSFRDINPLSDRFAHGLYPIFPTKEQIYDEACDKMVISENFTTAERYFFPTDSGPVKECRSGGNSTPWQVISSDEDDPLESEFPNLELALGGEKSLLKQGILPLFGEIVDKKNNQEKLPDPVINKDDDALSLSLALPFSNKERTVKPVSKTKQLLPEKHHVNTSLFLFGGFPNP
ncbi:hypothetical protein HHK36_028183 [Tetracentron sinense]|uniref:PHD-type domain-containing protein n=1 Tax=Tetracentron sinense TaxID=13715 RepID=A0A834YEF5_TETSI|nr:hypothetical protein HHK36_028183 [Tetracentron sinense]